MAISFLQAGDFHLDSPFSSLSPAEAIKARESQRTLLSRISTLANREQVDLVLLTGDLFDSKRLYPETLAALQAMFTQIQCPIFISPGNHDPFTENSVYAKVKFPKHVHVFNTEDVSSVHIPELSCTVYGTAFVTERKTRPTLDGFIRENTKGLHIGSFHANLSATPSPYSPISKADIAHSQLHYIALGHIHERSNVGKAAFTKYAYSGTIQGRGFDETGHKGILIGTLDEQDLSLAFYPICTQRYLTIDVDITNQEPANALRHTLPQSKTNDIVKFILKGTRHEALSFTHLESIAKPLYGSVMIEDQTTLATNYETIRHKHSLLGLFLKNMETQIETAPPEQQKTLQLAMQFGISALEQREDPL